MPPKKYQRVNSKRNSIVHYDTDEVLSNIIDSPVNKNIIEQTDDYIRPPDKVIKECLLPPSSTSFHINHNHKAILNDEIDKETQELLELISKYEELERIENERIQQELYEKECKKREEERLNAIQVELDIKKRKEKERKILEETEKKRNENLAILKEQRKKECLPIIKKLSNLKTFTTNSNSSSQETTKNNDYIYIYDILIPRLYAYIDSIDIMFTDIDTERIFNILKTIHLSEEQIKLCNNIL